MRRREFAAALRSSTSSARERLAHPLGIGAIRRDSSPL
jgi:hypothetical protein